MNIKTTINGTKQVLQTQLNETLLSVLRKNKLLSVKQGCMQGICGSCTVLIDDKPAPSCLVPIHLVKDREITTLEAFSKTEIYSDIMKGFNKAGIKLCGYCNAGKIFAAYKILSSNTKPSRTSISEEVNHLSSCCTDTDTLINGIIYAFEYRLKRAD